MSANEPGPANPASGPTAPASPPLAPSSDREPLRRAWRGARWLLVRGAVLLGTFVVFLLLVTGVAGWYTSRPEFCRSCHIMEPYYKSWKESTHSDVSCIECHFEPGFGGKVRGKMLGLVQLAKYVTESAGPRPAAEIPDSSCLRSGCHETRLLSGRVEFHGVPFDHTPHFGDLRRGKKLRCTSCHSQIVQGKHMTVTVSTCFLCHFKGEPFNEGLGACTRCHQIPDRKIDLGGGVLFSHDVAYERGVDCANCHGDLVRGKGEVPHERCLSCHNRERDLEKIGDSEFMHAKHVTDHKVDCLQCHLSIQHSLDRNKYVHAAGDCTTCHPDHHREQVKMLQGIGAQGVPDRVGGMHNVRVECKTCHRTKQVSATGVVLWKASSEICAMCHPAATVKRYEEDHVKLRKAIPELEQAVQRVREALKGPNLPEAQAAAAAKRLEQLQQDLDFLRVGNHVHNMYYAAEVSRTLLDGLTALCRELKLPEPKAELPLPAVGDKGTTKP